MRSGDKQPRQRITVDLVIRIVVGARHDAGVLHIAAAVLIQIIDAACVDSVSVEYDQLRSPVCVQVMQGK